MSPKQRISAHVPGIPPHPQHRSAMLPLHTQHRSAMLPPHTQHRSVMLPPHTQHRSVMLPPHTQHRSAMLPTHPQRNMYVSSRIARNRNPPSPWPYTRIVYVGHHVIHCKHLPLMKNVGCIKTCISCMYYVCIYPKFSVTHFSVSTVVQFPYCTTS